MLPTFVLDAIRIALLKGQLKAVVVSLTCRLEDAQRTVYESREKIERQNQQLSDYEAEINLLRRRLETLETDREKDKKTIATLQEALNRTRLVSSVPSLAYLFWGFFLLNLGLYHRA